MRTWWPDLEVLPEFCIISSYVQLDTTSSQKLGSRTSQPQLALPSACSHVIKA